MTLSDAIAAGLLTAGVAAVCLACVGLVWLREPLDRLHCVGLAGTCGVGLVSVAVLVAHPLDQFGLKAALLALITCCFTPLISHVQASLAYRVATSDRMNDAEQSRDMP